MKTHEGLYENEKHRLMAQLESINALSMNLCVLKFVLLELFHLSKDNWDEKFFCSVEDELETTKEQFRRAKQTFVEYLAKGN